MVLINTRMEKNSMAEHEKMHPVKQKQNRIVGLGFAVDVELGLVEGNNEC